MTRRTFISAFAALFVPWKRTPKPRSATVEIVEQDTFVNEHNELVQKFIQKRIHEEVGMLPHRFAHPVTK